MVKAVEDDENAEDAGDDDAEVAVEEALTETAKAPHRAALGGKKSKASRKVRLQTLHVACAQELLALTLHLNAHTWPVQATKDVTVADRIANVPAAELPYKDAQTFRRAKNGDIAFAVGDVVELEDDDGACELPLLGLVQCIYHDGDVAHTDVQVHVMVHGVETVLGDAASVHELFMTSVQYECPATCVLARCKAVHLKVCALRGWLFLTGTCS